MGRRVVCCPPLSPGPHLCARVLQAQLAVRVAAPSVQRAVHRQRQAVHLPRRRLPHLQVVQRRHRHKAVAVGVVAGAQLAVPATRKAASALQPRTYWGRSASRGRELPLQVPSPLIHQPRGRLCTRRPPCC